MTNAVTIIETGVLDMLNLTIPDILIQVCLVLILACTVGLVFCAYRWCKLALR